MKREPRVAVLGAFGHTGRFVVDALRERGATPIVVARVGTDRSDGIDRIVDFSDPGSLDQALDTADAVLNCAGPFFDTAEPAAWAALRAGIPYLDITAEQWTAARLFETMHAPAQARGVTIVPAMAFYGGLADLMTTALVEGFDAIDTVEIATALDRWHPTRGTRLTGARNTYPRLVIRGGALVPLPDPRPGCDWRFPDPFGVQPVTCAPMSEMVLLSRHLRIDRATSYLPQAACRSIGRRHPGARSRR
jgi:saccharopine dehydrogenase-like NADP-dependent oxidoreductase